MIIIPGYETLDTVYVNNEMACYRGKKTITNEMVLMYAGKQKSHSDLLANHNSVQRRIRSKSFRNCLKIIDRFEFKGEEISITEPIKGELLSRINSQCSLSLQDKLKIATNLLDTLKEIHHERIAHYRLTSNRIIVNTKNNETKLTDLFSANVFENDLYVNVDMDYRFASPEQVNDIRGIVDYRSDFYSLGIILYELFMGTVPFDSDDSSYLIHAHLTLNPRLINEQRPEIPTMIGKFVSKLLIKTPNNRYQNINVIKKDLERIVENYAINQMVTEFELGSNDKSCILRLSNELIGRGELIESIRHFINKPLNQTKTLGVIGYAGTGKTVLIENALSILNNAEHIVLVGKAQQYSKDAPFQALSEIFDQSAHYMLISRNMSKGEWSSLLNKELGNNGTYLTQLSHRLSLLLGAQPITKGLVTQEDENRFLYSIYQYFNCLSNEFKSITLFFDDIQWASEPLLKVIKYLTMSTIGDRFSIVLAERMEIKDDTAILQSVLSPMSEAHLMVKLENFNYEQIGQYLNHQFEFSDQYIESLTREVYRKTNGNPLNMRFFINQIVSEQIVYFDMRLNEWRWDVSELISMPYMENVLDNIKNRIDELSHVQKEVLQVIACISANFDVDTLVGIMRSNGKTVENYLQGLFLNDFVIKQYDETYAISHDRIQQAVYSSIDDERKIILHLQIGSFLLESAESNPKDTNIFAIVHHLNFGIALLEPEEQSKVARLNYRAGLQAKKEMAYHFAVEYLEIAKDLFLHLNEADNHFMLELNINLAEAYSLDTQYQKAIKLLVTTHDEADSVVLRGRVLEIWIKVLIGKNETDSAHDLAGKAIKPLGIHYKTKVSKLDLILEMLWSLRIQPHTMIKNMMERPEITDEEKNIAFEIMYNVGGPAYYTDPELFIVHVLQMLRLSYKHGLNPAAVTGFAVYSFLLCSLGFIERGNKIGKNALELIERMNYDQVLPRVYVSYYAFTLPWKEHINNALKPLYFTYQKGMALGDIEFASHALSIHLYLEFFIGNNLQKLAQKAEEYKKTILNHKQTRQLQLVEATSALIAVLIENDWKDCSLNQLDYNWDEMLKIHVSAKDIGMICVLHIHKAYLGYLYEELGGITDILKVAQKHLDGAKSTIYVSMFYYLSGLIHIKLLRNDKKRQLNGAVKKALRKMKNWSDHCPSNYLHKYYLLVAEANSLKGNYTLAENYYQKAKDEAKKNQYINDVGIISRLTADHYIMRGLTDSGQMYEKEAQFYFDQWGALGVVKLMKDKKALKEKGSNLLSQTYQKNTESMEELMSKVAAIYNNSATKSEIVLNITMMLANVSGSERIYFYKMNAKDFYLERYFDCTKKAFQITSESDGEVLCHPRSWLKNVVDNQKGFMPSQQDKLSVIGKNIKNDGSYFLLPFYLGKQLEGIVVLENQLIPNLYLTQNQIIVNLVIQLSIAFENAFLKEQIDSITIEKLHAMEKKMGYEHSAYMVINEMMIVEEAFGNNCQIIDEKHVVNHSFIELLDRLTILDQMTLFKEVMKMLSSDYRVNQTLLKLLPLHLPISPDLSINLSYHFLAQSNKLLVIIERVKTKMPIVPEMLKIESLDSEVIEKKINFILELKDYVEIQIVIQLSEVVNYDKISEIQKDLLVMIQKAETFGLKKTYDALNNFHHILTYLIKDELKVPYVIYMINYLQAHIEEDCYDEYRLLQYTLDRQNIEDKNLVQLSKREKVFQTYFIEKAMAQFKDISEGFQTINLLTTFKALRHYAQIVATKYNKGIGQFVINGDAISLHKIDHRKVLFEIMTLINEVIQSQVQDFQGALSDNDGTITITIKSLHQVIHVHLWNKEPNGKSIELETTIPIGSDKK